MDRGAWGANSSGDRKELDTIERLTHTSLIWQFPKVFSVQFQIPEMTQRVQFLTLFPKCRDENVQSFITLKTSHIYSLERR